MEQRKTLGNFIWRLAERFGARGVTFVVSIVLARILDPDTFGVLALVNVFIIVFQVFLDSGLGTALIQKKDADDLDFSSVFYFNLSVCLVLYLILFCLAGAIAAYFDTPELKPVLRVMGLSLIISGVKNIQQAYVSRNMIFKKFFFSTLGGTIGAAVVGIYLAWKGFGVWALVAQFLFNNLVDTIILWITVPWRPKRLFSLERLKGLLSFGWKLLGVSLVNTLTSSLRSFIIGKKYTTEDLAYYNKGQQFPQIIALNVETSIDSILLPTMSQAQDDVEEVLRMTRKAIRVGTYVMMPLMVGLAVCARPLVLILIKEKWLPCVPYMQILCALYCFYCVTTTKYNSYKALGRSDVYLKASVITSFLEIAILLLCMPFGVLAIAWGELIGSLCTQILIAVMSKKLYHYRFRDQIMDILPNLLINLIMGAAVYSLLLLGLSPYLTLLLQVTLGVLLYVVLSKVSGNESFSFVLRLLKKS